MAEAATQELRLASAQGRWVIAATVLGSSVAFLDGSVVGIALPALGKDLGASMEALQWVVNGYTLTLSALMLLGGSLGDRSGRRRIYLVGVVWFGVTSVLCSLAWSAETLVAARALQGIGGALLVPGSLAIIEASFHEDDRPRAIGAWLGLTGVATAIGPFVGGYLIKALSWRLIFLINPPLVAAVVLICLRHVPESRDPNATGRLDLAGAALATLGLAGLTYGLTAAPAEGLGSARVAVILGAGVASLVAFILVEHKRSEPMLPLGTFKNRQFTATNLVTFVVYGALSATIFLVPIVLQEVAGYSPLASGAAILPATALMLALSPRSGALARRIGPRLQMSVGPLIIAAGIALFARIHGDGGYLSDVLPAVLVLGAGLTLTVPPLTMTVLAAVPPEHAGMASAINNDVSRTAGLVTVALLPSAAGITGESYLDPQALDAGFRAVVLVAAAGCALGGLLAALTIRNPPRAKLNP